MSAADSRQGSGIEKLTHIHAASRRTRKATSQAANTPRQLSLSAGRLYGLDPEGERSMIRGWRNDPRWVEFYKQRDNERAERQVQFAKLEMQTRYELRLQQALERAREVVE